MSILNGLDAMIDVWLGIQGNRRYGKSGKPAYFSKEAAIDLSENGGPLAQSDATPDALVAALLKRIDDNWKGAGSQKRGSKNWLLRKNSRLRHGKHKPEKILEKLVVQLLGTTWFNQIATCSGMADREERNRSIDLGHDCGDRVFEFIELKYGLAEQDFGANNPLYAGFEILKYGLLFAHARNNQLIQEEKPLSSATKIHLQVLAPAGYYSFRTRGRDGRQAFNLGWLESAINKGLADLPSEVKFDFRFQRFTSDFDALYSQPCVLPDGVRLFQRYNLTFQEVMPTMRYPRRLNPRFMDQVEKSLLNFLVSIPHRFFLGPGKAVDEIH